MIDIILCIDNFELINSLQLYPSFVVLKKLVFFSFFHRIYMYLSFNNKILQEITHTPCMFYASSNKQQEQAIEIPITCFVALNKIHESRVCVRACIDFGGQSCYIINMHIDNHTYTMTIRGADHNSQQRDYSHCHCLNLSNKSVSVISDCSYHHFSISWIICLQLMVAVLIQKNNCNDRFLKLLAQVKNPLWLPSTNQRK